MYCLTVEESHGKGGGGGFGTPGGNRGESFFVSVVMPANHVLDQIIHRCFQHQVGALEDGVEASKASVQVFLPHIISLFAYFVF